MNTTGCSPALTVQLTNVPLYKSFKSCLGARPYLGHGPGWCQLRQGNNHRRVSGSGGTAEPSWVFWCMQSNI